ncbi:hypothetical protein [Kitasatospora sp. HPMI-4]|uniref:hypothetical protein n=1 Tax=Kitasatospora sp. HPMI-4 TaxID=3448443 RepID=UPI003F194C17
MDDFRQMLSGELSLEPTPPALGGLVEEAARAGRRTRRLRRWTAVAGSVAAVAVLAGLCGMVVNREPAGRGAPVALGVAGAAPATARPSGAATAPGASPTPAVPADTVPKAGATGAPFSGPSESPAGAAGGFKVPATPAGLLEQLLRLLPAGETGHYGGNPAEGEVQTYLTTAAGTGMIRLSVYAGGRALTCDGAAQQCLTDTSGRTVRIDHLADNCVQSTVVTADHGDGTGVQLDLGTCLAYQDGGNRPGVRVLTDEQAAAIAGNPALGPLLDRAVVQAGEARFPNLPTFS